MAEKSGTLSRRTALKTIGLAGAATIAAPAVGKAQAPAVRRRVNLSVLDVVRQSQPPEDAGGCR